MTTTFATFVVWGALALALYTYAGYPALLWLVGRMRRTSLPDGHPSAWPTVSITVPAYNEGPQMRDLLASLLALDYPRDRLQLLVVSDASSDGTDDIVREYADRGIELLRMPERGGKTRAENAASELLRGEIIVNTDASIRIEPDSLKRLVSVFADERIGLASGRDVSVAPGQRTANLSESGYVGYEMAIRDLETGAGGIIGASGCFYAIRADIHRIPLPDALSRDFASALRTHATGYRAVSVPDAVCLVPRTGSLRREYRRKVRTIMRGMETLWHERALLNPFRHPVFAFKLFSHKVCRWLLPWAALAAFLALGVLALGGATWALVLFLPGVVGLLVAWVGWVIEARGASRSLLTLPAFVLAANVAAAHALVRALWGHSDATWEPTRR